MSITTSRMAVPDDLVELGRVMSAHGVRGWIKVQPHSTQAQTLLTSKVWWLQAPVAPANTGALSCPAPEPRRVLRCRPHGATLIAELEGLDDRDLAQALKGWSIQMSRSSFAKPEEDEYYWVDLIGCWLYGEDDTGQAALIGQVSDMFDNGAHAVMQVVCHQTASGDGEPAPLLDAKGRQQETLVPFVGAHVLQVDLANKKIVSNWPVDL